MRYSFDPVSWFSSSTNTMQISKMTDKAQKLAKQLASEKTNSEQLQKSTANQASHQTSENRKLALEISKMKVSISTDFSGMSV